MGDLGWLRQIGWDQAIMDMAERGVPVLGICGGFQMLGRTIIDSQGIEAAAIESQGLGLLDIETHFNPEKTTWQVSGMSIGQGPLMEALHSQAVVGYEIHMG